VLLCPFLAVKDRALDALDFYDRAEANWTKHRMSSMKAGVSKRLESNPFRDLADLAVQSVQMEWVGHCFSQAH
jgi:hypothetical protein